MYKKNIIFICGNLSEPRCVSRITAFHNKGFNVKVYGYERGIFKNNYPKSIDIKIISKVENGKNYISKFLSFFISTLRIINENKKKKVIFYFLTTPFLPLVLPLVNINFINEISDIQYGYPKFRLFRGILKKLDRYSVKKSFITVFTSKAFISYLFKNFTYPKNVVVQSNMVDPSVRKIKRFKTIISKDQINFGFVGSIRFDYIYNFALTIGKFFPNHKFYFFGGGTNIYRFKKLSVDYENIYFNGPFKSPEDLSAIYSKIDMVVSCYDTYSLNVRLAEPNKLYESIFFCKPIIVSKNTYLSKRVFELSCGYSIDPSNLNSIKLFVEKLEMDDIMSKIDKISHLSEDNYLISHKELFKRINE